MVNGYADRLPKIRQSQCSQRLSGLLLFAVHPQQSGQRITLFSPEYLYSAFLSHWPHVEMKHWPFSQQMVKSQESPASRNDNSRSASGRVTDPIPNILSAKPDSMRYSSASCKSPPCWFAYRVASSQAFFHVRVMSMFNSRTGAGFGVFFSFVKIMNY